MSSPYSEHFARDQVALSYFTKFDSRLEKMRHRLEVNALKDYVSGDLFDCSIGSGRFVEAFPKVSSYNAMDFSPAFVEKAKVNFPQISVQRGDLTKPLEQPSNRYDTVLCMRTLFALPDTAAILKEMFRIARPGGNVCFDYGIVSKDTTVDGKLVHTSAVDIEFALQQLGVRVVFRCGLDGLVAQSKRWPWLASAVELSGKMPGAMRAWEAVEWLSARAFLYERHLWVVET